jgi:hypothetical protein
MQFELRRLAAGYTRAVPVRGLRREGVGRQGVGGRLAVRAGQ